MMAVLFGYGIYSLVTLANTPYKWSLVTYESKVKNIDINPTDHEFIAGISI